MATLNDEQFSQIIGKSINDIKKKRLLEKRRRLEEISKESNDLFMDLRKESLSCGHKYMVKIDDKFYCLECFGLIGDHLVDKNQKVLEVTLEDGETVLDKLETLSNVFGQLLYHLDCTSDEAYDELYSQFYTKGKKKSLIK